jgi:hypothetical protein
LIIISQEDEGMAEDSLKYFRIAQELNKKNGVKLKDDKLHFRGNIGSFSLISLAKKTPEQGKGGFVDNTTAQDFLDKEIDSLLESKREKIDDGKSRKTREKELQAWIIDYAINHEYHLPFSDGLTFLTSELAFAKPEKIVNDILALDLDGSLVVIELKSSRDKATLEGQVERFFGKIECDRDFFKELVKLLAPGKSWNGRRRGMIVWPDSKVWPNPNGQPRIDWKHGIEEIRYKEELGIVDGKEQRQILYNEKGEIEFLQ